MLFLLGYVLAGAILHKFLFKDEESCCCENVTLSDSSDKSLDTKKGTSFKVKEEVGTLSLPSCNLIAVQLGPSEDKKKAVLTLYLENKTSPHETFATGITLESKGVPITAYYSSVL